ncbi:clathrin associated protein complex large subunit [Coemansia sp. RSA 2711]|nr:clathrin associated protein complex large subunit [Coemansia sp. RSA 2711]
MFFRLKDLIRAVRVCKTATDERNVIRRESAAIRTSFKEAESQDVRYVNVQKLVYIYLLGQPVQFGQLECLKLAASARFADKRVGYLGVGLLVDETQEILTLLTNSLKTDLHSSDDYVVGLALGALASVASAEVAGDLADEVQRLAGSARAYVRKKAGLAAVRVVQRAPDAADAFVAAARALVGDRHHGVRLAGAALLEELSGRSAAAADAAAALVPELARQLRELATGAGGGEHGVRGIGDPFLQAALLRLVRVAARGSAAAADAAGDVLALVGAQDDAAGNVATALLYECAVTALAIPAGAALRGLAVNVLGRLLARADNNARCVALGALATAVVADAAAVQRHRATVLARLRDDDATIRRRALDLAFALVDADNAPAVVREILRALPHVDADQRASAAYRLAAAVALFAASREWHVDRMLRLLAVAGAHVRARDLFRFLRLVATADAPLQRRAARAAFALLERDVSQDKLVQAGVWLTGEYADLLVPADSQASANDSANASAGLDADGLDILGALGAPHGLRLTLTPSKRAAHVVDLRADFTNTGDSAVSGLAFQVAVPKSQKIQIHPPSGQHISAGSSVSQLLRVSNPTQAQLRLRMKIAFTADAQTHEHMLDFSGFPSTVV